MKKLSVILEELGYDLRIHHDITPRRLMSLAKIHGTTRWMIDSKDRIHAGAAYEHTHNDIANTLGDDDTKSEGAISYDKEKNCHYLHDSNWGKGHPHIKTLEKLGCLDGKRLGDYEDLKIIPINDWSN